MKWAVGLMTICAAFAAAVLITGPQIAYANEKVIALLENRGLVQSGNRWSLAEDLVLARKSESLDRAVRQLQFARGRAANLVAQNKQYGDELKRSKDRISKLTQQKQKLSGAKNKELREKLQEQIASLQPRIAALEKAVSAPHKLCERREAHEAITTVNAQQQRITLLLKEMPSQIFLMENKYNRLREDRQLMQAIGLLGPQARLASGANSGKYRQQLDRARRMITGDWIPVFRQNGHLRIAAIIERQTPATFTYHPGSGPAFLPASVVRKAGIKIPNNADEAVFRCADGRRLPVRVIKISYLQLGSSLLESVQIYALPPEGEDLGARITDESLGRFNAQLDLPNLRMKISP
ncbi:MAG: hypothetical protein VB835_15295 [Pirellulales bacterium]